MQTATPSGNLSNLLEQATEAIDRQDYAQALRLCDAILSRSRRPAEVSATARRLKCRALCVGFGRRGQEAVRNGRWAVRLARRTGDHELLALCLLDAATAATFSRSYHAAVSMLQEVIDLQTPPRNRGAALQRLGWIQYLRANYGLADRLYLRACTACPADPMPKLGLALVELAHRRPWRALQLSRQAMELLEPTDRRGLAEALLIQTRALARITDFRAAAASLERGKALADLEKDLGLSARFHLAVAEVALWGRAPDQARLATTQALGECVESGRLDIYDLVRSILREVQDQDQWPAEVEM